MKTKGVSIGIIQTLFSLAVDGHHKMVQLLMGHLEKMYKKQFSVCMG